MTLSEFLGHFSKDELDSFGTKSSLATAPSQPVHIPVMTIPTTSLYTPVAQSFLRVDTAQHFSNWQPAPEDDDDTVSSYWEDEDESTIHHYADPCITDNSYDCEETSTSSPAINPCTGLPEISEGAGIDVGGHIMYACDDSHSGFDDYSGTDAFSDSCSSDSWDW